MLSFGIIYSTFNFKAGQNLGVYNWTCVIFFYIIIHHFAHFEPTYIEKQTISRMCF